MEARSRNRQIIDLALPIIGGMLSQNVLNLVDTAMVGALGNVALAAVGMASFSNFLATAFITGLSSGVQAMAARRFGEGALDRTAIPLNGGLALALFLAVPASILLFMFAPDIFPYLVDDEAVVRTGTPYLQARIVGMAAIGMNFAFRGYWNGINLSRLYMRTLVIMHITNIALNYVLIFGKFGFPELGATGAGIGTAVSTYIGTFTYFVLGFIHARKAGFLKGLPDTETVETMLRLAVPAGVQRLFFAAGMTTFFWIVGKVGTTELAAANVLINVLLVCILPGIGFGLAAASLVGQALGRKEPEDAKRWGWDVSKLAAVLIGLIALPGVFLPDLVLQIFLKEPAALALARVPLQLVCATIAFDSIGIVLQNALLGAGATRTTMVVSITTQWFLFIPLAYLIGPVWGYGLLEIWIAQIGYRMLQTLIYSVLWNGGAWATIRV